MTAFTIDWSREGGMGRVGLRELFYHSGGGFAVQRPLNAPSSENGLWKTGKTSERLWRAFYPSAEPQDTTAECASGL